MKRVILIGCSAKKADRSRMAQDLYVSPMFKMRKAYAQSQYPARWGILSARFGVLAPGQIKRPYDQTIDQTLRCERLWSYFWAWGYSGIKMLVNGTSTPMTKKSGGSWTPKGHTVFELHTGKRYVQAFERLLSELGYGDAFSIETPLEGLFIGQQRAWYAKQRRKIAAT